MPRTVRFIAAWVVLGGVALAADPVWLTRSRAGMVATDSPEASRIGAEVLRSGGNAFDAAVAVSFALTVASPSRTGLGGGGFLVAFVAHEKRFFALDFREMAPAGATRDHYARLTAAGGNGPPPTIYGGNAVGIPGQLAGLSEIHKRFATRPWADLMRPAVQLAEQGFTTDEHYGSACREALGDFEKWPRMREQFGAIYHTLLGGGTPPAPGSKLRRPELAEALNLIAAKGQDAFYRGPLGEAIVRAVRAAGGALMNIDLDGYRVREREPLRTTYRGFEIVTMPPPSSGGVCLAETLNILAAYRDAGEDVISPWKLVRALEHAFADRARWLGDPDFCTLPLDRLLSREYARELAEREPISGDDFGTVKLPDDQGTSHFCVVDGVGNIVALTETINGTFGSLVIAEPYGILLNNQMDDFATSPGKPNLFGLVQGEANAVGPAKRPLSSMTPTIVLKDGRPVLVLGGAGGPRIITSVLQVLLNVLDHGMSLEEAMSAVRLHHQWKPDEVYFDREPPDALVAELKEHGVTIGAARKIGVVQAIRILDDGTLVGASDPRRGGRPAAP